MDFQNIVYEKKEGIATITLNRPQKLNAVNAATLLEISAALDGAEQDDDVRVVVITGRGRAFCAGDDIADLESMTVPRMRVFVRKFLNLMIQIQKLAKPVIAAVNGLAVGGGFELALACDLTIASEKATFALPEPRIGAYCGYAAIRLSEAIGSKRARELMFTGDTIDAKEAERIGLVNKTVPEDQLESAVKGMAEKLMAMAPLGIALTKAACNRAAGGDEWAANTGGATLVFGTEDFKEGVDAFIHKRQPKFRGR